MSRRSRRRESFKLAGVSVKENESIDSAIRRFKKACAKDGVLNELRKREFFVKPSVKRKNKQKAAIRRKVR